jgi:hypothetical protein
VENNPNSCGFAVLAFSGDEEEKKNNDKDKKI